MATRSAASAVIPVESNGGHTSTTSAAQRSSSAADAAQRAAQLARREAARLRRAGAGREGRVEHVDVDGQVDPRGARRRRGRSRRRRRASRPRVVDLVHRVPAEALRAHPVEVLRARPGAAQPDLDDVRAGRWPSSTATRNGVPWEIRTPYSSARRVGVGVEVDHGVAVGAERLGRAPAASAARASGRRRARAASRPRRAPRAAPRPGPRGCAAGRPARPRRRRSRRRRGRRTGRGPSARCGRPAWPPSSAARIARGPKRVPGRFDVPSSNGAPTTATSTPVSGGRSMTSRLAGERLHRCRRGSVRRRARRAGRGGPWAGP